MISIDELRDWLDFEDDDAGLLEILEVAAVSFVEQEFGRHFGAVASTTERVIGDGGQKLRLSEVPESLPATITEYAYVGADPAVITAADDDGYELRTFTHPSPNLAMLVRKAGIGWCRDREYLVPYTRGYSAGKEPPEIRQLVRGLVMLKWLERDSAGGTLQSEGIGPYTYSVGDLSRAAAQGAMSLDGIRTRWQGWLFA